MERTNTFYMANLGSEMLRAFTLRQKNDREAASTSALRCLKMVDTLLVSEKSAAGVKEIRILKSLLTDFLENDLHNYSVSKKDLETYFNPFAIRLMSQAL